MRPCGIAAAALAVAICGVAACTNGGGLGSPMNGGGGTTPSPPPPGGIGVAIPSGKIGVESDPVWGSIGGYTQNKTSQVLAVAPGTTITVQNLSASDPHTLNVIGVTTGPPPKFPSNPSLSFSPRGNGVLGPTYASGTLNPGKSVSVKLSNPGIYLIGCAFHYVSNNMRDVIQVVAGATPGPTASPGPGPYARKRAARSAKPAPEPQLIDQQGRHFTVSSLRGKPLIITFISTRCTDACPLIEGQFARAAEAIERNRLDGRLLTITLDPEHDSPRTMRALARRFDADPRYWVLAGGSVRDVRAVMHAFGVIAIKGPDGDYDQHTTFVYILGPGGAPAETLLASSALDDDIVAGLRDGRWRKHA